MQDKKKLAMCKDCLSYYRFIENDKEKIKKDVKSIEQTGRCVKCFKELNKIDNREKTIKMDM